MENQNTQEGLIKEFKDKWEGANTGSPLSSLVIMDMVADIRTLLASHTTKLMEEVRNDPRTFGITDKEGRGGAILVEDVIEILTKDE